MAFFADVQHTRCAYLLSLMHTSKVFVRGKFGHLSALAAKVVRSWHSCGSLTGGQAV